MSDPKTAEQINMSQVGSVSVLRQQLDAGVYNQQVAEIKALRDYAKELVHVLRTLKANAYDQARLACLLHGDSIDRALDRAKELGL